MILMHNYKRVTEFIFLLCDYNLVLRILFIIFYFHSSLRLKNMKRILIKSSIKKINKEEKTFFFSDETVLI